MSITRHPQYVLNLSLDWRLKDDVKGTVKCSRCNGHGTIGGGPMAWGDEDQCPECWGSRTMRDPELQERPEVPEELWDDLKEFWIQWFKDHPEN